VRETESRRDLFEIGQVLFFSPLTASARTRRRERRGPPSPLIFPPLAGDKCEPDRSFCMSKESGRSRSGRQTNLQLSQGLTN